MIDLGAALTLGQMVDRAAAQHPDREAIVFKKERVTYAELKRRADDFARGLLALGLGPGDHVVLWMPNRVEWAVLVAAWLAPAQGMLAVALKTPVQIAPAVMIAMLAMIVRRHALTDARTA